jgi:hypothetical protein
MVVRREGEEGERKRERERERWRQKYLYFNSIYLLCTYFLIRESSAYIN